MQNTLEVAMPGLGSADVDNSGVPEAGVKEADDPTARVIVQGAEDFVDDDPMRFV